MELEAHTNASLSCQVWMSIRAVFYTDDERNRCQPGHFLDMARCRAGCRAETNLRLRRTKKLGIRDDKRYVRVS